MTMKDHANNLSRWNIDSFNLRSYGLLIEDDRVLLSKEWYPHYPDGMIKFPGGGVKLGEGVGQAVRREFIEELEMPISIESIFHVPDGFLKSHFDDTQVVAFYWNVKRLGGQIPLDSPRDILTDKGTPGRQKFMWIPLGELKSEKMTFPFDKEVAELLIAVFRERNAD
tara:strand:- start:1596 stop:2099 length:504 start_codon:yes stop_codon:yes gene_type:complete